MPQLMKPLLLGIAKTLIPAAISFFGSPLGRQAGTTIASTVAGSVLNRFGSGDPGDEADFDEEEEEEEEEEPAPALMIRALPLPPAPRRAARRFGGRFELE